MNRFPLPSSRLARLGMTAALSAAILVGGAVALLDSHSARATTVRVAAAQPSPDAPGGADATELSGTVLETLAVSSYTYLRLSTSTGEVWAAVPSASVEVGRRVAVANATRMLDFKSGTLDRTFEAIYFGTLAPPADDTGDRGFSPADILEEEEQALPAGHPDVGSGSALGPVDESAPLPAGHPSVDGSPPHGGAAVPAADSPPLPSAPIPPARGSGAHVIVELAARRHELAGKIVRVRGQVTKVTPNVQGHTFFHLRDGNPLAAGEPSDLIVSSTFEPSRGQVATFEGVLRADVDVGIGHAYSMLLENATVVPE